MNCPTCDAPTRVIDTRKYRDPNYGFDYTERRRVCSHGHRHTTTEMYDSMISQMNGNEEQE